MLKRLALNLLGFFDLSRFIKGLLKLGFAALCVELRNFAVHGTPIVHL